MSIRPRPAARHGRGLALPLLFGALTAACAQVTTDLPPLQVEYAGCRRAFAGPVCEPPTERDLTLWIAAPPAPRLVIEVDGQAVEGTGVEVQLGRRYQLELGKGARKLVVRSPGFAPWKLTLKAPDASTWWQTSRSHLRQGDNDAAREVVLKARLEGLTEPGPELSILARAALSGEVARARDLLGRAIQTHRERGEHLQETHDAATLFDLHLRHNELPAARAVLSALPGDWGGPAEAAYVAAYVPALLANATGDLRSAVRLLEAALARAERLDLRAQWLVAGQVLARQLRELGRGEEATALLGRLLDVEHDYHSCFRGQLLNNAGWISLLALEAGEDAADPDALLRRALAIFEQDCPQLPYERVNVRLNMILAQLHGGRLEEARQLLGAVRELAPVPDPWLRRWLLEIEGRLALADGRPEEALDAYDRLADLATATFSPEARWRAALGKSRALDALGRPAETLSALAEADRLLDRAILAAPLTEGRETFIRQREEGARRHLDRLLAAGREAEALAVARRARLRGLRAVLREDRLAHLPPEEQERWDRAVSSYRARRATLDAEVADHWRLSEAGLRRVKEERAAEWRQVLRDLDDAWASLDRRSRSPEPPPRAGELLLVYHPLPEGWVGFAQDASGLMARRLDCEIGELTPETLGTCLLTPFAVPLARARQVRVLPYGPLRQVDFHALSHAGDALLAGWPVVYGLDVRPPAATAGPGRALVIADPSGDLPAARREARTVARSLSAVGGWQVRSLRGEQADGGTVRDLLSRADLFHYAGHAVFAGLGGWESALPLAGGSRLTVGDVLTLERAPRWVVLSGCDTGRSSRRSAVASISLAHAFLAAGAGSVVAATRPVSDATTSRLIEAFYRAWSGGAPAAVALRDAQLALRRDDPEADGSAFRLIEP